jgi:putative ABC transport system permease protein
MLKNMVVTAWRNLKRKKMHTLVNLFGLAVGLAYFAMIAVMEDLHFQADRFHEKADRIYGVVQVNDSGREAEAHSAFNPGPLLSALRSEFPEIEGGTRVLPPGRLVVRRGENVFYQTGARFVDADFLSVFSFPLISGSRMTALSRPYSVVLSQSAAEKYFGRDDPLGKTLSVNGKIDVTVTAVAKNLYENSSIRFEMLISMDAARVLFPGQDDWSASDYATFLVLAKGTQVAGLDAKLAAFVKKSFGDAPQAPKKMYFFPLLDFRLKSLKPAPVRSFLIRQEVSVIYMQYASAVLVLLIACLNFMILATSRNMKRAREIAMRKIVGAGRWELIKQFLTESVILALLALPPAILIYSFAFPLMTDYIGQSKDLPLWNHPFLFKYLLGLTVFVGLFAGSYPAFFLSAFKPGQVLKGELSAGKRGVRLRKILVVAQFSLAVFLMIWTMMFKKQFRHFWDVDFGYDRSRVIAVSVNSVPSQSLDLLKKELQRLPAAVAVGASIGLPGDWGPEQKAVPQDADESRGLRVNTYGVAEGFSETIGLELVRGRSFSREFNDQSSLLINETLARQFGWDQPLGKQIAFADQKGIVVGVVEDFQFRNPSFAVGPALFFHASKNLNWLLIKFRPGQSAPAVTEQVKKTWDAILRDFPFEATTLEVHFEEIYRWMDKVSDIMTVLNSVILFVSGLGLLGLVSYAVEKRTREIGIRKVLGASVPGIVKLVSSEFLGLVLLANVAGMGLSVLVIRKMFQMMIRYNRAGLDVGMFVLTAVLTLAAAAAAMASQVLRAARANPVESLHYE